MICSDVGFHSYGCARSWRGQFRTFSGFRARVPNVAVTIECGNKVTDVVRQERGAGVESMEGARVIVMYRWTQDEVLRRKSTLWAKEGEGRWLGRKRDLRDVPDTDASEHRVELS